MLNLEYDMNDFSKVIDVHGNEISYVRRVSLVQLTYTIFSQV